MEHFAVNNMAVIRIISGLIEIGAAIVFIKSGRVDTALRMNALLGIIGPVVFIAVSVFGIAAIAVRLSWMKILLISAGILLVVLGTKS